MALLVSTYSSVRRRSSRMTNGPHRPLLIGTIADKAGDSRNDVGG